MSIVPARWPLALVSALVLAATGPGLAQAAEARPGVALVVTLKAKAGRGAELEAAFREFIGKVDASGLAIEFELARTSTPGTYRLIELFRDEAALAAHRATPHVRAFGQTFGELLDGPNQVEQMAVVQ